MRSRSPSGIIAASAPRRIILLHPLGIAFVCALGAAWLVAAGCATPARATGDERAAHVASASFAVYALSRGRGVPEPTRAAWQTVWRMLEDARRDGKVTRLQQTRLGLEGEVRLCAEFSDPVQARELLERAREVGKNVELFNVVEEPCPGQ